MTVKLTKKEKGFVRDYLETGHGTQSVLNNYDTTDENVAGSIASQNLKKLRIQEALQSHAEPAESMIFNLSQNAEAEAVRLNASKDIMDRAGYKPVEKSQSINVNVELEATDEIKKLADQLNELQRSTSESSNGAVSRLMGEEVQD